MTRGEAIEELKELLQWYLEDEFQSETFCKREAVEIAVKALSENKGEWIESKERSKHWYCSVCGGIHTDPETGKWRETFDYRYPFCPICGAKMERGET